MDSRAELEVVRRRIGALEHDLVQLKRRVETIERDLTAGETAPPAPEPVAGPAPFGPPVAPVGETLPVEEVTTEPPLLVMGNVPVAPASAPREAAAARAVPPPSAATLREWLEPLQLWPPSGEENAEVRLGAWWATRIGALLAVIGVVFLGIYVSRDASPWLRLAEVVAVTVGVLVSGAWLERKLPKFGAVLFGAGLALAYFAAFAAHGVAPMRVIESPVVAIGCELLVVGGIFGAAWRRGSPVVATMAVALGHVTAFLALRGEPAGFGPWVVLLLGAASVLFRWAREWQAPSVLAMPLAWLFLAVAAGTRNAAGTVGVSAGWGWAALYFLLFFARDWVPAWRGAGLTRVDRVLQVSNSTLAFAVSWFCTAQAAGERLATFYFGSAAILFVATAAWRRVGEVTTLAPIFACKTAGILALAIIATFDGQARYLVLLAQAFVMLVAARQSAVRGLRIATILTGAVALGFYMSELRPEHATLATVSTVVEVAFLAGAMAFVAAAQRWLAFDAAKIAFGAVVVGLAAISTALTWDAGGWSPAINVGLGVVLLGVGAAVGGWLPAAVASAMLFVAAHVEMWGYEAMRFAREQLWLNEAVLFAAGACAAFALRRWEDVAGRRRAHGVLVAIATATLSVVCFKALPATTALALTAAFSWVLVLLAGRAREWPLAALSTPLLALGFVFCAGHGARGPDGWLIGAAILAWAAPAWLVASPRRRDSIEPATWRAWAPAVHSALATALTWYAVGENVPPAFRPAAFAAAALLVFGLAVRPGLRPALESSWVLWVGALIEASDRGATTWTWGAAVAAWLPVLVLTRSEVFARAGTASYLGSTYAAAVQVVLATMLGVAVAWDLAGATQLLGLGAVAAMAFGAWRATGAASARFAGLAVVALGWAMAWLLARTTAAQGWGAALVAVLAAGGVVLAISLGVDRTLDVTARRRLRWVTAVAGLALVFRAFAVQRGELAAHATVGWGLFAVATFLLGLFAGSRAHRLTGLGGLALAVGRAFAVDLDSTLHRIVAFVALGLVLLWVGFSYHRFRHLITDEEKKL